jgi:hypothetical protein
LAGVVDPIQVFASNLRVAFGKQSYKRRRNIFHIATLLGALASGHAVQAQLPTEEPVTLSQGHLTTWGFLNAHSADQWSRLDRDKKPIVSYHANGDSGAYNYLTQQSDLLRDAGFTHAILESRKGKLEKSLAESRQSLIKKLQDNGINVITDVDPGKDPVQAYAAAIKNLFKPNERILFVGDTRDILRNPGVPDALVPLIGAGKTKSICVATKNDDPFHDSRIQFAYSYIPLYPAREYSPVCDIILRPNINPENKPDPTTPNPSDRNRIVTNDYFYVKPTDYDAK